MLNRFYKQAMLKRTLIINLYKFFFNNKTPPINQKEPQEELENKSYLASKIIEANKNKPKLLPPSDDPKKLTIVFELDEFLSYTFSPDQEGYLLAPRRKHDFHLWFQEYEALLNIYKRKNLDNFLAYLSVEHEPVLFTTGVKSYVELVLGLIDPEKRIKNVFTQQHCDQIVDQQEGIDEFVKDLNLLGRDMKRVIYIDSKPMAFWLNPQNGLYMEEFRADNSQKDEDLDLLILQLEQIRHYNDVREYLLEKYNLKQLFTDQKLL